MAGQVVIENPILNSPYREPTRHFRLDANGHVTNAIDPGRRGRNGNGGRGTTRRTGGDQQRQEEGQPEASRAVHLPILLRICVSVNASRGGAGCGVAV